MALSPTAAHAPASVSPPFFLTGSQATSAEDFVFPALRRDLTISHQLFEGRAYAIIKDPLSLKYFRLAADDCTLAQLLDGQRSVAQVRAAYWRQQPQQKLTQTESHLTARIQGLGRELELAGFLEASAEGVRRQMELKRLKHRPLTPWGLFMKALFLKIPLGDPDALLTRLERPLRPLWSWTGFIISLVIFLAGAAVFAFNFPRIAPSLSDFLSLPNLALVWLLTILVKVVHEFGHGLTCKHYGGEVHEMGALVMVFSPFLYADVSDSYLFPNKRHRILVAAAGIYIELVIAAIATLLWAVSQPGPTQQLLFNLMLITSVWTVLFNANPLMKFDGYYILMDLLGVPNLRSKAQLCVSDLCRRFFFGGPTPPQVQQLLPQKNRTGFVFYSVAAQLYLLQITLGIAAIFHFVLQPYGLSWLGDLLGAGALLSMLVVPVVSFFKNQFNRAAAASQSADPQARRRHPMRRPLLIITALLVLLGGLAWVPWQITVERPAVLRPQESAWVRAEVPGRFKQIVVKTGDTVTAGQPLAYLTDAAVEAEARSTALLVERARRQVDMALGASAPAYLKQAEAALATAVVRETEARRMLDKLTLYAPVAGTVITPDLERLQTGSLRPGEALCEVAALRPMQIYIPLNERQARHVSAGQAVDLRVHSQPGRTYSGHVATDLKTPPAEELPPNLIATLGGDIAAQPDAEGKLKPLEVTYGVLVTLPNDDTSLRPGMTGSVRIHGPRRPLWEVVWMDVLDFISLDYRL